MDNITSISTLGAAAVNQVSFSQQKAQSMVTKYNALLQEDLSRVVPYIENLPQAIASSVFQDLTVLTEKLNSISPEILASTPGFFENMDKLLVHYGNVINFCENVYKRTGTIDYASPPLSSNVNADETELTGMHGVAVKDFETMINLLG